ncbi:hypothetical protein ABZ865_41370 [Streptomyces sp. NPDC047085]|uniref:hypothetical protein n=1 Tax=Streptomyces sp. NPDC047085 TaxID=3155140 RepID=UPI0033E358A5
MRSSCLRFPVDVPSGGRLVVLQLRVRRFFCPQSSCARFMFAEQMPGLTRRHGGWTKRLRSALAAVVSPLPAGLAPGWYGCSGCPSAAARCCGCSRLCPNRKSRPRGWWGLMGTPRAKGGSTARCSSASGPPAGGSAA